MNVGFLEGLRVLELGDGVAGASAAGLLAGLGAEVTSVIDTGSAHRRGRPAIASGGALLGACLDRGKELRVGDHPLVLELLGMSFDLVIVDRVGPAAGALAPVRSVDDYVDFVEAHNKTAWLTISAFGLSGLAAK